MNSTRKSYPSDVSDEEWALVAPYLTLLPEESGQRSHSLREAFNGLRYIVNTGDSRTPRSTPDSGERVAYDGAKRACRAKGSSRPL